MDVKTLRRKYRAMAPGLTERSRRLWAAAEAAALGHGGIALVERATGISRSTITRGMREVESGAHETLPPERARRWGGGRKLATEKDTTLLADLEALVEPTTSGDPDSPLRWTSKSVRHLAEELQAMGHDASHRLVATLLHECGYSLQANRKTREGPQHPDRDAQFRYIADQVRRFQKQHQPAISVDTKKKELVGDFTRSRSYCSSFRWPFSSTCTSEMCAVADDWSAWQQLGATVIGISVDSPYVNVKFAEETKAPFPIVSDFNREATRAYDALRADLGGLKDVSERAVFVINRAGTIVYTWQGEHPGVMPPLDEVKGAVRRAS